MLSNGVVEYIEGASGKPHLITTLRDGGSFDQVQYTTTAGRNVGENLKEEIEREHFEEGPFLGTNAQGEYVLAIPANEQTDSYLLEDTVWNTYNDLLQSISDKKRQEAYTVSSVIWWLENKYTLKRENEQDARFIRAFERHFPGIKYEELGDILRDIVDNKRFVRYGWDRKPIE